MNVTNEIMNMYLDFARKIRQSKERYNLPFRFNPVGTTEMNMKKKYKPEKT